MSEPETNTGTLGMLAIQDGSAPTKRLEDATKCVELVQKFIRANLSRLEITALAKRIRDRKRPYNQKALEDQGRGWYPNINFGDAESDLNNATSPYYDIFSEVPRYYNITVNYGDANQKSEWSQIISEEVHNLLWECDIFDFDTQRSQGEMISFGFGPCCWENEWDFRFKAFPHSSIYVPQSASTDPNLWEVCAVKQDYLVGDLWKRIRNRESAKEAGWNEQAVLNSIANAHEKTLSMTSNGESWELWADRLRRNDIWYSYDSQYVEAAHVLTMELDGSGISHGIVDLKTGNNEYLYYKKGVYTKYSEFITVFPFDIGDGTLYSIKGMIVKNSDHYQIQDRLKCQILAGAFIGSSLVIKAGSETQDNEIELVQMGPVTRLPASCTIDKTNLSGLLEGPLGVDRYFEQHRLSNMGQYKRINDPSGQPLTATGENLQAQNRAILSKGAMNRYYRQLDKQGKEVVRRIFNPNLTRYHPGADLVFECRNKIIKRGVPARAFEFIGNVTFYRNAGQGSADVRELQISKIISMMGMYPESVKMEILRMATASIMGQDIANQWLPREEQQTATDQMALATLETASIRDSVAPLVTETQDHVAHIGVHANDMMQVLESVNNGGDPMQALQVLVMEFQHTEQHLAAIEGDNTRKAQVKALGEMLGTIRNSIKKLEKNVTDMVEAQQQKQLEDQQMLAQAQAAGTALDPETQLGMAKIQAEKEVKMAKVAADHEVKVAKTRQGMDLKAATTAQNLKIKEATTKQGLAINDVQTANKIINENKKTAAKPKSK